MDGSALHTPVMLRESIDHLISSRTGIYVDATLGMGGYSRSIAEKLEPGGRIFGFDVDTDAIREASDALSDIPGFQAVHANFSRMKVELAARQVRSVSGIVFDLGVSSLMLDSPEKGFSHRFDGPLDMRMDQRLELTASDIVNTYVKQDLERIFRNYGEERQTGRIVARILKTRERHPYRRSMDLVDTVAGCIPEPYLTKSLSRIFQALRIEVNGELTALAEALEQAGDLLETGGRLVVVSYHSLEDRIVKEFMRERSTECICPPKIPVCICGHHASLKLLTRRGMRAGKEEQDLNNRSRSAILRAAEKLPEHED